MKRLKHWLASRRRKREEDKRIKQRIEEVHRMVREELLKKTGD
jgi:hypothetical protein